MSWRTWVGQNPQQPWADFSLCEHGGSIGRLAAEMNWHLPARIMAEEQDRESVMELLDVLEREYAMPPTEFWTIKIVGREPCPEHPTWEQIEGYLGLPRPVAAT